MIKLGGTGDRIGDCNACNQFTKPIANISKSNHHPCESSPFIASSCSLTPYRCHPASQPRRVLCCRELFLPKVARIHFSRDTSLIHTECKNASHATSDKLSWCLRLFHRPTANHARTVWLRRRPARPARWWLPSMSVLRFPFPPSPLARSLTPGSRTTERKNGTAKGVGRPRFKEAPTGNWATSLY